MKRTPPRKFYVYEHWRPDKNEPFYVGKGFGRRARKFERNKLYNNIVAKLVRLGMCVEVRMIENGLSEHEAFALEAVRIRFWRSRGIELANLTDGGEGPTGFRNTVVSNLNRARKWTDETIAKHKASQKRRFENKFDLGVLAFAKERNRPKTKHEIEKRVLAMQAAWTPEITEKRASWHRGRKRPLETGQKISAAKKGRPNPKIIEANHLRIWTEESRNKRSVAQQKLRWITNGTNSTLIDPVLVDLPDGWVYGRLMKRKCSLVK